MRPKMGGQERAFWFVLATLCELPMMTALAGVIAPEFNAITTMLLMAIAVLLNWLVLSPESSY